MLLPSQPVALIGRERELSRGVEMLRRPEIRLVTLTGTGGCGKTRLAVAVAESILADQCVEMAVFVDLSPIHDAELVLPTIADALGIHELAGQALVETVARSLRVRGVLLVLDNLEQVLSAAVEVVPMLLSACVELKVLATSREPLHVRWEHELPLAALDTPSLDTLPDLDALSGVPSVALFVDRAQAVRPDFSLTAENARAVAEVCVSLDGLPLALELAAAHVRTLSLEAIGARLARRLDVLVDGPRDLPSRHRSLRAAIGWSVALLPPSEQALFRRLAVFAAGWSVESAAAVADVANILEPLGRLVRASLVTLDVASGRFRFLETVREFAREQLELAGELDALRERHARFFLALAEAADLQLVGPNQVAWRQRLHEERDNLREAVRWCVEAADGELGLRITSATWRFWESAGTFREGLRWLEAALARNIDSPTLRARALVRACSLARMRGQYARGRAWGEESYALRVAIGDRRGAASSLQNVGLIAEWQGDLAAARQLYAESLAVFEELGDTRGLAASVNNMGNVVWGLGELDTAAELFTHAMALHQQLGNTDGYASAIGNLGCVESALGQDRMAEAHMAESLALFEEADSRPGIALQLANLSRLARRRGDRTLAVERARRALALYAELGESSREVTWALDMFSAAALIGGDPELAAQTLGAAHTLRTALGVRRSPADTLEHESIVRDVRAALSEREFARAWERGLQAPLEQTLRQALAPSQAEVSPAPDAQSNALLTRREREVATLVARGLTNRQIADALTISERTAEGHVERIRDKLGVHSRTLIARWALDQRLVS